MFQMQYVFTADGDWSEEWRALGVNHHWLPPAVRRSACYKGRFRPEYDCDVAFVGSNGRGYHEDVWPYRRELVDRLVEICQRRGWSFRNPGGSDPKVERGAELNDFYASARVCVGDSLCIRRERARYWSDRVPETLGRGGRLIMPQIDALRFLFTEQALPMYGWGDWLDLERQIEQELSLSASQRAARIETTGPQIRDQHTYTNRVQKVLRRVGLAEQENTLVDL